MLHCFKKQFCELHNAKVNRRFDKAFTFVSEKQLLQWGAFFKKYFDKTFEVNLQDKPKHYPL